MLRCRQRHRFEWSLLGGQQCFNLLPEYGLKSLRPAICLLAQSCPGRGAGCWDQPDPC